MVLLTMGACIIYFNLFGSITSHLVLNIREEKESISYVTSSKTWVLIIGAISLFPSLQKSLKELKIISFLLFGCTVLFCFLVFLYFCVNGTSLNTDSDFEAYWDFKVGKSTITAISVFLFAFTMQFNILAMYTSMKEKTTPAAMKSVTLVLLMSMTVYFALALMGIYIFGSSLQPTFLNNLDKFPNLISYAIRIAFLIIIGFHIPFIFFACKEFMLTMIDELMNRSVSKRLDNELTS